MENKEKIEYLLRKIDIEIGSTITYSDNEEKVLKNMQRANLLLSKLKNELNIEF